jgi:hypothetical protein
MSAAGTILCNAHIHNVGLESEETVAPPIEEEAEFEKQPNPPRISSESTLSTNSNITENIARLSISSDRDPHVVFPLTFFTNLEWLVSEWN